MTSPKTPRLEISTRLELTAKLFRGLADPSRLALLEALRGGERAVSDLVITSGLSQSNTSGHLACLKECGLVLSRQEGRFVYYRLAVPEVEATLASAEHVLDRLAERIAACANYDRDARPNSLIRCLDHVGAIMPPRDQ